MPHLMRAQVPLSSVLIFLANQFPFPLPWDALLMFSPQLYGWLPSIWRFWCSCPVIWGRLQPT